MDDYINPRRSNLLEEYSPDKWYLPHEVADLFGVDASQPAKWLRSGKLKNVRFFRTPGGHYRYSVEDINYILESYEDSQ